MINKLFKLIWNHKIITLVVLSVLGITGFWSYKHFVPSVNQVSYITDTIKKGMLVTTVSGSGQVSASSQVDIKPKISGDIVSLNVKAGQEVKEKDIIAQIDTKDSIRSLNSAKSDLETAKLDLEDFLQPTDTYTLLQAKNAIADAEASLVKLKTTQEDNNKATIKTKTDAENNLIKAYEDAYNDIADTFLDLPDIMTGLNAVLYSYEIGESEASVGSTNENYSALLNSITDSKKNDEFGVFVKTARDSYASAKSDYDANLSNYQSVSRYSSQVKIEELLSQTLEAVRKISDTAKSEINMLDYWVNYQSDKNFRIYSKISTYQSDLSSYTSQVNGHLSSLLAAQSSIKNYKDIIVTANEDLIGMEKNNPADIAASERSLEEKKQKLSDLNAGADELEIRNKKITIQQKENSLADAQQAYADCFIRAPFDGVIAAVNVAKGDSASSGAAIATIITNQKIAEITLNEIDAAKVKVGQKANLTFDAASDLSITGEVAEVNALGTVSQGVVSYGIKISFDVQDERIKSGMSVTASIILESKQDIVLAPIGAIKTSGQTSYAEILVDGQPDRKIIKTGLSNDTMIEIIEGLVEGDKVITQTVSSDSAKSSTATQNSSNPGGDMGGMMRIMR
ncbi:MAG: efflux RND transporter periplasmic adaptor subunit [Patescibacteria group bacterium]